MKKALFKTFDRARSFVVDGLNWRGASRPYALVVWGLLAGLVWVALELVLAGQTAGSLLLLELALLALLTIVAAIDARFGIIPDSLSAMLLITGALNVMLESSHTSGTQVLASMDIAARMGELDAICWRLVEALVAVLGAIVLRTCYRLVRSEDGFGWGDVKFVGAAVLWVGLPMLPLMLMVAVCSAFGTILLLRKQGDELGRRDAIPFGPHLALGLWLAFLVGAELGT